MKLRFLCCLLAAFPLALLVPAVGFAASLASDKASDPAYSGGWTTGSNGGVGWGSAWTNFIGGTVSNTPSAQFIGSSTNNNSIGDPNADGDIDTSGKAWGLQGNGQAVYATRSFNGPMTNGQRFVISMDNGYVPNNGSNPEVGFFLKNNLWEDRLQFILTGVTNIYNDGALTGITNTDQGLRIEVEMVNIDTAKVSVTTLVDGTTHIFSNILMNAGVSNGHHQITGFVLENISTGGGLTNQVFFNSIYILPDTNDPSFFADQSLGMATSPNPVLVNSNLTYTITVTNRGPAAATGMTVTDVAPSGVTFVSATSAQGTCTTDAFGRVVCSIGSLASNNVASIALVVTPHAAGAITNIAFVSALNVDPNLGDNALTNIITAVTPFQAWQIQYFGGTTNPNATADADADGTGQNNLFKYVAGLDPTNPASVFTLKIASVNGQPSQKNLIFNPITGGRTYTIESRTNLVSGSYAALASASVPQTNGTQVTVTDLNAVQASKFYHVHISLP